MSTQPAEAEARPLLDQVGDLVGSFEKLCAALGITATPDRFVAWLKATEPCDDCPAFRRIR